jgi:hypothetical protein
MTAGSAWQFVYVVAALVTAWAIFSERRLRATMYRCPICGSHRQDAHSSSCPWRSNGGGDE